MESQVQHSAQSCDVRSTLFYAGDIRGRGRFDVVEPDRTNLAFVPADVEIRDARPIHKSLTLEASGFMFADHASPAAYSPELFSENMDHRPIPTGISRQYQMDVADFLKELTGAREVFPQMGGLLARTSVRAKTRSWAGVANFVHLDYTARSAQQFLDWTLEAEQKSLKPYSRYSVFQTWRAVSPGPQDNSLAVCDGSSVPPEDGVVIDSVIGPEDAAGTFFESRLCKPRSTHKWYYLANMEPRDLLVFKGFDSEMPLAMNAMHTAFDNPLADDTSPPRQSIEARFFAIFD
ncbi:MAG: hypothetical protein IT550_15265 [Novosphingobium sp.]|jgi:hypothetical protein|nr:hypothetical protein [Novosphingobium sp.]